MYSVLACLKKKEKEKLVSFCVWLTLSEDSPLKPEKEITFCISGVFKKSPHVIWGKNPQESFSVKRCLILYSGHQQQQQQSQKGPPLKRKWGPSSSRDSETLLYRDSNCRGFTEQSFTANVSFSIWDISLMWFSYSKFNFLTSLGQNSPKSQVCPVFIVVWNCIPVYVW